MSLLSLVTSPGGTTSQVLILKRILGMNEHTHIHAHMHTHRSWHKGGRIFSLGKISILCSLLRKPGLLPWTNPRTHPMRLWGEKAEGKRGAEPLTDRVASDLFLKCSSWWPKEHNAWGQWAGSVSESDCHQVWPPEFQPWDSHRGRRESTLKLPSDIHMQAIAQICPPPHAQ